MTWAEFLAELRADLQDTDENPRWDDATLFLYTKDAVREYSTYLPRRIDRLAVSLQDSYYPLPSDYVEMISVEAPLDSFLEERDERPGVRFLTRTKNHFYYIQGGNLYVDGSLPDEVFLTYMALHPVPDSEEDLDFEFTIPERDLELIRTYVKAKVYEQMRSRQSALDRFKTGAGRRDDNPLDPNVDSLYTDFYQKIYERIPSTPIRLYRIGRAR